MAGGTGFEPVLAESESAVLPLDDPPFEIGDTVTKTDYTPLPKTRWALISVSSIEVACGLFAVRLFYALPRVNHELQIQLCVTDRATFHHIARARV